MIPKNTICLWYDRDAEAAARFYAATFPDSEVRAVAHGRTQGEGLIFDRAGHHVVTAGQVGLVRLA